MNMFMDLAVYVYLWYKVGERTLTECGDLWMAAFIVLLDKNRASSANTNKYFALSTVCGSKRLECCALKLTVHSQKASPTR